MNQFDLLGLPNLSVLNIAYILAAMCVTYKLAFIVRALSAIAGPAVMVMRAACLAVGTIVLVKAYGRIHGGDEAQLIDILRELSWCVFLASSIIVMRGRLGQR